VSAPRLEIRLDRLRHNARSLVDQRGRWGVAVTGIKVGSPVTSEIKVYPTDDPAYGYFYAGNRVYIVDMNKSTVVASPGYLVPQQTVTYVQSNPGTPVTFSGDIAVGTQLPEDVTLTPVPDDPDYSYVYIGDRPVLVDRSSRTVVYTR